MRKELVTQNRDYSLNEETVRIVTIKQNPESHRINLAEDNVSSGLGMNPKGILTHGSHSSTL